MAVALRSSPAAWQLRNSKRPRAGAQGRSTGPGVGCSYRNGGKSGAVLVPGLSARISLCSSHDFDPARAVTRSVRVLQCFGVCLRRRGTASAELAEDGLHLAFVEGPHRLGADVACAG